MVRELVPCQPIRRVPCYALRRPSAAVMAIAAPAASSTELHGLRLTKRSAAATVRPAWTSVSAAAFVASSSIPAIERRSSGLVPSWCVEASAVAFTRVATCSGDNDATVASDASATAVPSARNRDNAKLLREALPTQMTRTYTTENREQLLLVLSR